MDIHVTRPDGTGHLEIDAAALEAREWGLSYGEYIALRASYCAMEGDYRVYYTFSQYLRDKGCVFTPLAALDFGDNDVR